MRQGNISIIVKILGVMHQGLFQLKMWGRGSTDYNKKFTPSPCCANNRYRNALSKIFQNSGSPQLEISSVQPPPHILNGTARSIENYVKRAEKRPKPWHMGTHLRVLIESYPMNTNMAGFKCFSKFFASLCFG